MPNENQDSGINWKTRLEDLDRVPSSFGFDKAQAWEDLYPRLAKKGPRNHRFGWLLAAAATLLVVVTGGLLQKISGVTEPRRIPALAVPNKTVSANRPAGSLPPAPVASRQERRAPVPAPSRRGLASNPGPIHLPLNLSLNGLTAPPRVLPMTDLNIRLISQPSMDSMGSLTLVLPSSRKLKVVHLNELGLPSAEEELNMARTNNHHIRFFNLYHEERTPENLNTPETRTPKIEFIKIALSPQN